MADKIQCSTHGEYQAGALAAQAQPVAGPLTRAAIFLVATLNPGLDNRGTLRTFCGDLTALLRAVEFRDLEGGLSCVMGFGSDAWDRLFGPPRPAELHQFRRSAPEGAMQSPRRVTCCSTSAPSAWIYASSLPLSLWRGLETPLRRWMKCKHSVTSTTAI